MKKENKENIEKKDKKIDKRIVFKKIMAALLIIFMLLGTCYTFIYLIVNA